MFLHCYQKETVKEKIDRKKIDRTSAPKSPYSSDRQNNIDIAYDILKRKDKKSSQKSSKVEGKIQGTTKGYAFLIPDDITMEDVFIPERENSFITLSGISFFISFSM